MLAQSHGAARPATSRILAPASVLVCVMLVTAALRLGCLPTSWPWRAFYAACAAVPALGLCRLAYRLRRGHGQASAIAPSAFWWIAAASAVLLAVHPLTVLRFETTRPGRSWQLLSVLLGVVVGIPAAGLAAVGLRDSLKRWGRTRAVLSWTIPSLITLLTFFVVWEVILRWSGGEISTYDVNPAKRLYYQPTYNRLGFRGPVPRLDRPPGWRRIMIVGDSYVEGVGVMLHQAFPQQVQAALQARGEKIDVVAFGRCGNTTADELQILEGLGPIYRPEVAVVAYVLNDAALGTQAYPFRAPVQWLHDSFKSWSYVYFHLWRRYNHWCVRTGRSPTFEQYIRGLYKPGQPGWHKVRQCLGRMRHLARLNGFRVCVVLFPYMTGPYPFTDLHRAVARTFREDGLPVCDLREALFAERRPGELALSPADTHPNALGHALAAKAIVRFLSESGLMP